MIDNKIAFGGGICAVVVLAIVFSFFITPIDARDNPLIIEVNKGGTSSGGNVSSVNAGNAITVNQTTGNILVSNNGVWNNIAGSGISVNQTNHNVLITNTAQDNTVCANVGNGKHIYKDGECNFKTLVGSSDISITNNTDTVIIDYNGTAVTSVGATSPIVSSGGTTPNISCPTCLTNTNSWILLDNVTSTNALTTFSSNSYTGYKYINIQIKLTTQTSSSTWSIRFNSDSGNNYGYRSSTNGGADATANTQAQISLIESVSTGNTFFVNINCENFSSQQKLCIIHSTENEVGTTPSRVEEIGLWYNTANQITSHSIVRIAGTGTLTTSSNMVVLGHN